VAVPGDAVPEEALLREADSTIVDWLRRDRPASALNGAAPVWAVKPQAAPKVWDRYWILLWQYKTAARKDIGLYRKLGVGGWHIDRGEGRADDVRWAVEQSLPYYVDHAAGKGILHLTPSSGRDALPADGQLGPRPASLLRADTIAQLTARLDANLPEVRSPALLAVALDDETSLGTFNSPFEVDTSPVSLAGFRLWLRARYGSLQALNAQWATSFSNWSEIQPVGFGELRRQHTTAQFESWNLSRWIDWRAYMDTQFALVNARLVTYAHQQAIGAPVGIVGGQQPSPYGGYDYDKLRLALDWIESYDIGGTNEILRSFWSEPPRRPIVQTYFSSGDLAQDRWFLWYYLLHGNAGAIVWPDRHGKPWFQDGQIDPHIQQLAPTFRAVQAPAVRVFADPASQLLTDKIAVLYSHPSVQASWVSDVATHGGTWPRRLSGLDNTSQSAGKNRVAWMKLLEDCGYQAKLISDSQLVANELQNGQYKALILPRAMALSDLHCQAIRRFVDAGGTVIADYWTAVLDEHGKGRRAGGLDDLFGVQRDWRAGAFEGNTLSEIDGEKFQRPFLERLPQKALTDTAGRMIVERGTRATGSTQATGAPTSQQTMFVKRQGSGRAVYLNLSPVAYYDNGFRTGPVADSWRDLIGDQLRQAGLQRRFSASIDGRPAAMVEALFWENAGRTFVGVIGNPSRQAATDGAGLAARWDQPPATLTLHFPAHIGSIRDVRNDKTVIGSTIEVPRWQPSEGVVLELLGDQPR